MYDIFILFYLSILQDTATSSSELVDILLGHIQVDTTNAVRRDLASEWRLEGGLAPMICRDVTLSDSSCTTLPSLALAVWMTNLILCLFIEKNKLAPQSNVGHEWFVQLSKHWSFSLRSPSLPVKTCALKILIAIVSSCSASHPTLQTRVVAEIPMKRLRLLSQVRLAKEKGSLPVCSEFLQSLLELVAVGSDGFYPDVVTSDAESSRVTSSSTAAKDEESKSEEPRVVNDNWEAISGRIFSDEGWETWTGHVVQRSVSDLPAAVQRLQERQDLPPELMPGCKVCRKRSSPFRDSPVSLCGAFTPTTDYDDPSTDAGNSPKAPSADLNKEATGDDKVTVISGEVSPSTGKLAKVDAEDQIGTVLQVATWAGHPPGSARLIKWDDEIEPELVRWDADNGTFDVTHIKIKNGRIAARYYHPHSRAVRIANRYFGLELTYGIIVRLIKEKVTSAESGGVVERFRGFMEWPDFAAVVRVSGVMTSDGGRTITEDSLVSGPCHTGWDTRFGQSSWRAGTTYHIRPPTSTPVSPSGPSVGDSAALQGRGSSSCQSDLDVTDSRNGELRGTYSLKVPLSEKTVDVEGELVLQQSRLFVFDEKNSYYNITVSSDKMTVAKNGGSGQACAFGSVGFSSGIHFWEFKIEQADVGSIFLGVAEKPGVIGSTQASRFGRWVGSGLANHRASFRSSSQTTGDRLSVYGDHFHTGDTVGVLLDMNRGRLSFYLDGLKYGQHTIADLGEAFDGLTTSSHVKKRTMFPIVGLSKSQDRIAITPRWLSSIGTEHVEDVRTVQRAHQLLAAWSAAPPPAPHVQSTTSSSSSSSGGAISPYIGIRGPNILHDTSSWLFREAYSDWKRWLSARYIRVRSRCQAAGPLVAVDITPRACVEACIRLGLPYTLLRGDRVLFSRSSGRKLDTKEEAVILGSYKGQLWYRLDSQQGQADGGIMESAALAWSLVPSDIEGLTLLRRSYTMQPTDNADSFGILTNLDAVGGFFRDSGSSSGDSTCSSDATTVSDEEPTLKLVAELPLPRIPSFQGGLVLVTYANGAVMRDGLEIDTSEVLCSVPAETVVYALEQRLNSSNVWRLRVLYGGHYGWISERMRGGSEEYMLKKVKDPPQDMLEKALKGAADAMNDLNISARVQWDAQPSISAAMEKWDGTIHKHFYISTLTFPSIYAECCHIAHSL
jgi:SPRY domain